MLTSSRPGATGPVLQVCLASRGRSPSLEPLCCPSRPPAHDSLPLFHLSVPPLPCPCSLLGSATEGPPRTLPPQRLQSGPSGQRVGCSPPGLPLPYQPGEPGHWCPPSLPGARRGDGCRISGRRHPTPRVCRFLQKTRNGAILS